MSAPDQGSVWRQRRQSTNLVSALALSCWLLATAAPSLVNLQEQKGGGNPFAALGNMGNIMENVKKAQQLVQVEAAKAQEELARYTHASCLLSITCLLFTQLQK